MGKSKATFFCPYIFHLYHIDECLLQGKKDFRTAEALLKHNVEPEEEDESEALEDSERKSLSSKEIQEIQRQEFSRLKKSSNGKRGSPVVKDLVEQRKTSTLLDLMERNYQTIANNLKDIRAREYAQGELIRPLCKKLGKVKPNELEAVINNLPTRKKVNELEAKNSFLLEKANKLRAELKEQRKEHQEVIDKLNSALLFN